LAGLQLKFVEISTTEQLLGLKRSIQIKSIIIATESALDVERLAMKHGKIGKRYYRQKTQEEFIEDAKLRHGDRYDYSKIVYNQLYPDSINY
jgi:hypothetical protein